MTRHRVALLRSGEAVPEDLKVESIRFPGGEVQIKVQSPPITAGSAFRITAYLDSSEAIMELLLLTDALRRLAADAAIALVCPYFPYARQDRVCAPGEALSVRVMADLINAQRYISVEIWDAHSDVTGALVERVRIVPALDFVRRLDAFNGPGQPPVLVAPDAGAMKKVAEIAKALGVEWVRADKSRDPKTGLITGTLVYSDPVGTRDFLIVDDICDGGRTFTALARVLRPLTDGKIMLYVTHGIFSAGYEPLLKEIDVIFTANRLRSLPDDPRVRLI
jgi:ribose-phosphate pyrophosphokinase